MLDAGSFVPYYIGNAKCSEKTNQHYNHKNAGSSCPFYNNFIPYRHHNKPLCKYGNSYLKRGKYFVVRYKAVNRIIASISGYINMMEKRGKFYKNRERPK